MRYVLWGKSGLSSSYCAMRLTQMTILFLRLLKVLGWFCTRWNLPSLDCLCTTFSPHRKGIAASWTQSKRKKFVNLACRENTARFVALIYCVVESGRWEVFWRVKLMLSYTTPHNRLDFFRNDCARSLASSERFRRLICTVLIFIPI